MNKIYKTLFIAFGVSCLIPVAKAQLSGDVRKNFMASGYSACYQQAKANPDNKTLSDKNIAQFCKCVAVNNADGLTNDLVLAIESGKQPATAIFRVAQMSANFCRQNYLKY
jgi:hypothetical protein